MEKLFRDILRYTRTICSESPQACYTNINDDVIRACNLCINLGYAKSFAKLLVKDKIETRFNIEIMNTKFNFKSAEALKGKLETIFSEMKHKDDVATKRKNCIQHLTADFFNSLEHKWMYFAHLFSSDVHEAKLKQNYVDLQTCLSVIRSFPGFDMMLKSAAKDLSTIRNQQFHFDEFLNDKSAIDDLDIKCNFFIKFCNENVTGSSWTSSCNMHNLQLQFDFRYRTEIPSSCLAPSSCLLVIDKMLYSMPEKSCVDSLGNRKKETKEGPTNIRMIDFINFPPLPSADDQVAKQSDDRISPKSPSLSQQEDKKEAKSVNIWMTRSTHLLFKSSVPSSAISANFDEDRIPQSSVQKSTVVTENSKESNLIPENNLFQWCESVLKDRNKIPSTKIQELVEQSRNWDNPFDLIDWIRSHLGTSDEMFQFAWKFYQTRQHLLSNQFAVQPMPSSGMAPPTPGMPPPPMPPSGMPPPSFMSPSPFMPPGMGPSSSSMGPHGMQQQNSQPQHLGIGPPPLPGMQMMPGQGPPMGMRPPQEWRGPSPQGMMSPTRFGRPPMPSGPSGPPPPPPPSGPGNLGGPDGMPGGPGRMPPPMPSRGPPPPPGGPRGPLGQPPPWA